MSLAALAILLAALGASLRAARVASVVLGIALLLLIACGGGSGGGGSAPPPVQGGTTPAGNYTITVNAVDRAAAQHSVQVTLAVQ